MLLVRTAAKSEARPLFGFLSLFYFKMAGRANSIDLEVPGGKKVVFNLFTEKNS